jgi:hypothetical protein
MPANVRSIDAIEAMRAALATFGEEIAQSVSIVDIEMRRVLDWLEHDRPRYWKHQVRTAMDGVTEARAALHRALMYPINDERPSCDEERAALKRAEAKFAYCEEKAERLRQWIREVRHEMFEYEGRMTQLNDLVELDVPHAIAIIRKLVGRLEEYQSISTTVGGSALAEALWAEPAKSDGQPAAAKPVDAIETNLEGAP